jgi:archaellum component FlaC
MRKSILLAAIGLFSFSYADDNSPILDYYKPIQSDSLDKRVNYIESTFNAKIENVMEQIRSIQNKQADYENAMKYIAAQTKKEIEDLKTQVETLTEEVAKLKGEKPSISAQQPKETKETESSNFCTTQTWVAIVGSKRNIIARVKKGVSLEVLGESEWSYKVKHKDDVGYISKKYCKIGG